MFYYRDKTRVQMFYFSNKKHTQKNTDTEHKQNMSFQNHK